MGDARSFAPSILCGVTEFEPISRLIYLDNHAIDVVHVAHVEYYYET